MGNLSSHFDYSDFVEVVNNGIKINGLPTRDQKLLDNFFLILQGVLINDPPNLELPKNAPEHFGWAKSYITNRRNVPVKISDIYNQSKGERKKSFNELSNLTQKQLAHLYSMIMLIDGVQNKEDLSKLLQNSDFSQYLFHDGTSTDYQKIDHWLKLLSKLKTEKDSISRKEETRQTTDKEETRHFVKREELKDEGEKDSKPQTLEEYLDQILFKLDGLHKMYHRIEKKLDDEKLALRKKTQS